MFKYAYWLVYIVLWPIYRFKFSNRELLPEGACVVCGNHTANIDSVLLILAMGPKGDFITMAKAELFKFKPFGWLLSCFHVSPVNRGKGDMAAIRFSLKGIKDNKKMFIFPEGTRVKDGSRVEMKSGAGLLAIRTGVPLVPVFITPGKKAFRGCTITFGQPYAPFYEGKPDTDDYQRVTEEVMDKVFEIGKGLDIK